MDKKAYIGIDYFRIIAALLIIAIHISPLSIYSETGDFIFTRIIARVAVPFFLMTSGFFLISRYNDNTEKLKTFVKNSLMIYGAAIVIYIPINIYNHYFSMDNLLPNIIKDFVFDGTMYHLWYLPASIIGAGIAWYLVKKMGMKGSFTVSGILYIIGMLGDSYYGFVEKIPFLKTMYEAIFEVSDYTRNGIFFAPVFLILGGIIAETSEKMSVKKSLAGFAISFALMFCEGMKLHRLEVQRHDSMYIMLIPCMFFLFSALTKWRGERKQFLRSLSLVVYIIHPMVIVAVRMTAKVLHMQAILVENSFIHYFVVTVLSFVAAILIVYLYNRFKPDKGLSKNYGNDRAWIEIDTENLKHNIRTLQNAMPKDCEMMAVVKAEAYGHGAFKVAKMANQRGVKAFAVATIDEGMELRRYGIQGDILILSYTEPERAKELHKFRLTQSLIDYDYAIALSRQGYRIKSHIKINTGMNRLGFDVGEVERIAEIFRKEQLGVCGMYTHLCVADSLAPEDVDFTHFQIESFYGLLARLSEKGISPDKIHIQSSYGFLNYPHLKCNYVRVGIALYGVLSSARDQTKLKLDLKPVLSLKSRVVLIRKVKKGEMVGYGRQFVAERDSYIAIISVGYADGFPRNLSCGKGNVLINGYEVPIVGRICMDQLAVDVTEITKAAVGDIVTLIGRDGDKELRAPAVADKSDSIANELLSRMGTRLVNLI